MASVINGEIKYIRYFDPDFSNMEKFINKLKTIVIYQ